MGKRKKEETQKNKELGKVHSPGEKGQTAQTKKVGKGPKTSKNLSG